MWDNFLMNSAGGAGWGTSLFGAGAAIYGGIQQNKMAGIAKQEADLAKQSYYRNVLREDKEDKAIDAAGAAVKV